MTTHTDTNKLAGYKASGTPSLGNEQRFISGEFGKIQIAIQNIEFVLRLMEARMNSNGLT